MFSKNNFIYGRQFSFTAPAQMTNGLFLFPNGNCAGLMLILRMPKTKVATNKMLLINSFSGKNGFQIDNSPARKMLHLNKQKSANVNKYLCCDRFVYRSENSIQSRPNDHKIINEQKKGTANRDLV